MVGKAAERRGEAICLMCGTVVGEVRRGRFHHHDGCERAVRWQARLPRCCRCGGSLYFDPSLSLPRYSGSLAELEAVGSWEG